MTESQIGTSTIDLPKESNQNNTNKRVSSVMSSIQSQLYDDIKSGKISVSQENAPLTRTKKQKKMKQVDSVTKMKKIADKKQSIQRQLRMIREQEKQLHRSQIQQQRSRSSSNQKYFISKMTTEDVQKLKNLQKIKDRFQQVLKDKTETIEKNARQQQQEEQNKRNQELKKKLRQKEDIQKSIQMREKRKQQDNSKKIQEKKRLEQIKNQIKFYESAQQRWKEIQESQNKQKQEMFEQLKKQRKVDFDEIREHQRKYQETLKQQKQSRLKNSIYFSSNGDQGKSLYQSKYLQNLKEEDQRRRSVAQEKISRIKELMEKKKLYGETVKAQFKPVVKKNNNKQNQNSSSNQTRSLSLFECNSLGNGYMRTVNQKLSSEYGAKPKQKKQEPKMFKYTNYLSELKQSNRSTHAKANEMSQLSQIMKNKTLPSRQKFEQAKYLVEKIEKKSKNSNADKRMISSISAKMMILNQLS